ncbi:hypothetical protein SCAR479_13068 [Seiridium cardinale]|uniref:Uncharacterized protein n=1 Tax=Seiridium cardinale TaxID=138064 RepID=A0ABR2X9B0_9PEZI
MSAARTMPEAQLCSCYCLGPGKTGLAQRLATNGLVHISSRSSITSYP